MSLSPDKLAAEAAALQAAGKLNEAIIARRKIVSLQPKSSVAEHNLAAVLGDAGRWREAHRHIRRAFDKGIDHHDSWLVLARALQQTAQLDDSERAFLEALRRCPGMHAAHQELSQLRWMRTGDLGAALDELDKAVSASPGDLALAIVKAKLLETAGEPDRAFALLQDLSAKHPTDVAIVATASQLAATIGNDEAALALGQRAATLAPNDPNVLITLTSACLGAGQIEQAGLHAGRLRALAPNDQYALALQATAWRILGDSRYRALYDYDAFVSPCLIDTPKGWPDLTAYLADLAPALRQAHAFTTHPFRQSVRQGSQASDILDHDHPAIAALPQALDGPIKRYVEKIGHGADPLRARNQGGYAFQGMWSIRMSAGGFHVDHVHPRGWISSACYIEVPNAMPDKHGWLKFGEPGFRTTPALAPEHFYAPAPGKLVLFPSYMWHGTVPFTDASTRMTVAFDLIPAAAAR